MNTSINYYSESQTILVLVEFDNNVFELKILQRLLANNTGH